jgi:hypothetical protein
MPASLGGWIDLSMLLSDLKKVKRPFFRTRRRCSSVCCIGAVVADSTGEGLIVGITITVDNDVGDAGAGAQLADKKAKRKKAMKYFGMDTLPFRYGHSVSVIFYIRQ